MKKLLALLLFPILLHGADVTVSSDVDDIMQAADNAAILALLDLEAGTDFYAISDASPRFQALAVAGLNDAATPSVLTTAETVNTLISNYKASGADHVFTMPAAHAAANGGFIVGDEFQVDIEPPSGAAFYLNGTAMATDEHIQNTADTLGDIITYMVANINGTLTYMFYTSNANWVEETP